MRSEDTVPMKTKRADFAAAIVRGRMVVAGGLGKSNFQKRKCFCSLELVL